MARQVLVDRIIKHLRDAVVKGAFIGAADVHAGLLAYRFKSLELTELVGVVSVGIRWVLRGFFGGGLIGHAAKFRLE
jgi:hypothetical protein